MGLCHAYVHLATRSCSLAGQLVGGTVHSPGANASSHYKTRHLSHFRDWGSSHFSVLCLIVSSLPPAYDPEIDLSAPSRRTSQFIKCISRSYSRLTGGAKSEDTSVYPLPKSSSSPSVMHKRGITMDRWCKKCFLKNILNNVWFMLANLHVLFTAFAVLHWSRTPPFML